MNIRHDRERKGSARTVCDASSQEGNDSKQWLHHFGSRAATQPWNGLREELLARSLYASVQGELTFSRGDGGRDEASMLTLNSCRARP